MKPDCCQVLLAAEPSAVRAIRAILGGSPPTDREGRPALSGGSPPSLAAGSPDSAEAVGEGCGRTRPSIHGPADGAATDGADGAAGGGVDRGADGTVLREGAMYDAPADPGRSGRANRVRHGTRRANVCAHADDFMRTHMRRHASSYLRA